jgi:acyl carrier protein
MTGVRPAGAIVAVIADVLGCDPGQVRAATALYDLPGFDSLALVTILTRLEDALGVEVPAEQIVPEAFDSVGTLAGLLETAAVTAGGRGGTP